MFMYENITVKMSSFMGATIMVVDILIVLLTKSGNLSLQPKQN
jgi:uncharacterized membrane protein YkgB